MGMDNILSRPNGKTEYFCGIYISQENRPKIQWGSVPATVYLPDYYGVT